MQLWFQDEVGVSSLEQKEFLKQESIKGFDFKISLVWLSNQNFKKGSVIWIKKEEYLSPKRQFWGSLVESLFEAFCLPIAHSDSVASVKGIKG